MSGRDSPARLKPSGFFVLRTPLLPFTDVTAWGDGLQAPAAAAGPGILGEAVAADRVQLRRRLEDIVTAPEFRDALFVASPSLAEAVDLWRKEPDGDKGLAVERSLVSYLMRAAARPTPFGLFAGCTTGAVSPRTRLRLRGLGQYRRHTRLDMDYLWALAEAVERDPRLRAELGYRPNSSLYQVGDRLLYAEARQSRAGRSYRLIAVGVTPYLIQTLTRARDGARLDDLAVALVDDEVTRAEADEYIAELADSQVLVADVLPQLTGAADDADVRGIAGSARVHRRLRAPDRGGGRPPRRDRRRRRRGGGRTVPGGRRRPDGLPVSPDLSRFVQVDLMKSADEVTMGADVAAELLRGTEILRDLTRHRTHEGLRQFREQFTRRYETREVPLAQALDEENGIGFERSGSPAAEAPLLAGLPFGRDQEQAVSWTRRDTFLLGKLGRALASGGRDITIEAAEASAVRPAGILPLPDAFEVVAAIMADDQQALGRGDFRVVLHSASGPSGARCSAASATGRRA